MDMSRLSGHIWTVVSRLIGNVTIGQTQGAPWSTSYYDDGHEIAISGYLLGSNHAKNLIVLLHGLGGGAASPYCRETMSRLGGDDLAILSVDMRGADRSGQDFYHCGLTSDLHALIRDSFIQKFDNVFILGFSVGGHVALKFATEPGAESVRAVAAICCPIDLGACSDWMDGVGRNFYRRHVLKGLKEIYAHVAEVGHEVPTPVERVLAIKTFREWDELTVVPRFGFNSVEEYYRTQSVSHKLRDLRIPSLLIAAENDPMVPAFTIRPHLENVASCLKVCWVERGGHLGFPKNLDLGLGDPENLGLAKQILSWYQTCE